ncbi:MAG: glycosyltransferase family 87 protein [Chloroflexota bacterium]
MSATAPVTVPPPIQTVPSPPGPISLPLFVGLVLAGLTGLFVLLAFYLTKGASGSDWYTFYAAAERWRNGGQVYTVADGFFNPPPTLLLLRLFIVLPYLPSRYLWGALSAIMLLGSAWLTADALGLRPTTRTMLLGGWWILVSVPCVLLAPLTGNWSALSVFSYTLAIWLFYRGREGAAGAVLALTLVKPQLALFTLPLLVYKRRGRACAGYLAACAVALLVSLPLVGVHAYADYLHVQRSVADWTLTNDPLQHDVPGIHGMFLQHWPQSVRASTTANLISLVLVGGLAWFWRGPWRPRSQRFVIGWAMLLLVTLEASSFAHSYDLVLLIPPCIVLFMIAKEKVELRVPAKATLIALYVGPALVLLFRQHFLVPAMLAAIAVLWAASRE